VQRFTAKYLFILSISLAGTIFGVGCASNSTTVPALFENPKSFEGQVTTQCGLLQYEFENVNFYPNRRAASEDDLGLGVSPGDVSDEILRGYHNQSVCLTGNVRYAGCAYTTICLGSNFLYEIVVDDLVRATN